MEYIAAVIASVIASYLLAGVLFYLATSLEYPEVIYEWGWWLYKNMM